MKFTLALLSAIYLAEHVEGRRTSKYATTRGVCDGFPDEVDNTRLLNDERTDPMNGDISGRMSLTQVMNGQIMGPIVVRSHWLETPESDDWSFEFRIAADCAGKIDNTYAA